MEEHVFMAWPVTIGQSLRCRLSIPADGLPAEHVLFARDQDRLLLRPLPRMTGRIAPCEDVQSIELAGGREALLIERGARGKLCLGEVTILFQEVPAPPAGPRPRLPASVRGTLADRIDPRLAAIVALSLLVHLGIAAWAHLEDVETGSMFSPRISAERYRPEVIEITLPDEPSSPAAPHAPDGPGAAAPVSPRQTARPIVPRAVRPDEPGMTAAEAARYAQVLTGDDETSRGSGTDLRERQPGGDLKQQIDDIRDHGRDARVGRDPRSRDPGTRPGTIPQGPRIDGPDEIVRRADDRERKQSRIDLVPPRRPPVPPDHDLTAEAVVEKIRTAYLPGLQRCYQQGLSRDGSLSGKINLAFTVDEKGHVTDPSAHGLSPEVDACVAGLMPAWRFGIPRDKDRQPTEATFTLGLVLSSTN